MTDYSSIKEGRGKTQISVYVDPEVKEHFKQIAEDLDESLNAVVSYVLKQQMKEDRNEEGK